MLDIALSPMQREYRDNANRRWNVKTGATRSGKTWFDTSCMIPLRLLEVKGLPGLTVFLGNTKGTLQRNVIDPMQERFGVARVSNIRADNTATIFGERVYCLGADTKKHVNRLRGASFKYAYGDEVVTWDKDVFDMLKSRLDKPYSRFDGTCNPSGPTHWFKQFLESGADIFQQSYTIDDNPFLPPEFVENLKREYAGTILYDRYILGRWVAAEGAIYRPWCDDPERFTCSFERKELCHTVLGVDFGGDKSAHAFVLVGFLKGFRGVAVLREYYKKKIVTPTELEADFIAFAKECQAEYGTREVRCDSAETTLISGLKSANMKAGLGMNILNAQKKPINDRIRFALRQMGRGTFFVDGGCKHVREGLSQAVWDEKYIAGDKRLDNGAVNIDSLDAMEYAFEPHMKTMLQLDGVMA